MNIINYNSCAKARKRLKWFARSNGQRASEISVSRFTACHFSCASRQSPSPSQTRRCPVARLRACSQQLCSVLARARCLFLFQSFFSVRWRSTRWAAFKMSFVNSELYDGIKVFSWLADLTGLPIDMVSNPLFHARKTLITARRCCERISPVRVNGCVEFERFIYTLFHHQNKTAPGVIHVLRGTGTWYIISLPWNIVIPTSERLLYEQKHFVRNGKHAKFSQPAFLIEYILFIFTIIIFECFWPICNVICRMCLFFIDGKV